MELKKREKIANDIRTQLDSLYKQQRDIQKQIKILQERVQKENSNVFVLSSNIKINTTFLSTELIDSLKQLATFDNPQINILLNLRKPIFNTPYHIYSDHLSCTLS